MNIGAFKSRRIVVPPILGLRLCDPARGNVLELKPSVASNKNSNNCMVTLGDE